MTTELTPKFVDLIPEEIEENILYVSFEYNVSFHLCPCGCQSRIIIPFGERGWEIKREGSLISFSPSIGNWYLDCKSHYFIIKNKIHWANT